MALSGLCAQHLGDAIIRELWERNPGIVCLLQRCNCCDAMVPLYAWMGDGPVRRAVRVGQRIRGVLPANGQQHVRRSSEKN